MGFLKYALAITWSLILLYLSISPGTGLPKFAFLQFPYADKLLHLIFYAIFSLLLTFSRKPASNAYLFGFSVAFGYGCLMEGLQEWVFTWRSGEWLDLVANFTGTITGLWLYKVINK